MNTKENVDFNDDVFEEWNPPDTSCKIATFVHQSNLNDQMEQQSGNVTLKNIPAGIDFLKSEYQDKCFNSLSEPPITIMSPDDKKTPTIPRKTQPKSEEGQYYEWPPTTSLRLPTVKLAHYGNASARDEIKPNVLEVPQLASQGKSISLANLDRAKCFLNPNQVLDRYALSVPSSPDSFYCDSLYSSGATSADLNSPTSSPLLSRSLSCDVLHDVNILIEQSRRSNSSDSAVVIPSEERMALENHGYFHRLDLRPQLSLDESEKTFASLQLSSVPKPDETNGGDDQSADQIPSPLFSMPSVVVSDHSDFYRSFDEYSSFDDSLCSESHIQYWHQFRKLSDCSSTTGSITSTPSLDEEENEEQQFRVLDDEKSLLPSGWRKVRNIVHWSPFVQTYKKQKYPWVQLAGHKGSFKPGEHGTILKKLCPKEEKCLIRLMKDELYSFVPEYKGRIVGSDDEIYLQLQDLLKDFDDPCVMDCKIGVRTYLEDELSKAKEKAKLRKDMYEKMIQVDSLAATEEEHRLKGVTKPRYMVWRETISSTATLGFRIDGMKRSNGLTSKDFKMTKTMEQVTNSFRIFIDGCEHVLPQYVQRLKDLKKALERSSFFETHELIGSSLLFVHDKVKASIWMIDFAKTQTVPDGIQIDHKSPWDVGNHEDGYLIGIDNLIQIFSSL